MDVMTYNLRPAVLGSIALPLACLLGSALLFPPQVQAQERPNLSGTWYFSPGESDDPQEKLGQQAQAMGMPIPQAGRPGESEGGGGRRPGGRGGPSEEEMGRLYTSREKMQELFRAQEAFDLMHSDTSLTWISRSTEDATLHLRIGKTRTIDVDGLGEVKTKASWDDIRMKVQRKIKDGPTIKEYYALSTDRSRLLVDVVIDGGGLPGKFEFRRIYTRSRPRPDSGD
jgi:hypothetical protein